MSDYNRVLTLLKTNSSTWYPTYQIAKILGIQANSVQRSINSNLKGEPIDRRTAKGSRCKEYKYGLPSDAQKAPNAVTSVNEAVLCGLDKTKPTGVEFGDDCVRCGASGFFSHRPYRSTRRTCGECGNVV